MKNTDEEKGEAETDPLEEFIDDVENIVSDMLSRFGI